MTQPAVDPCPSGASVLFNFPKTTWQKSNATLTETLAAARKAKKRFDSLVGCADLPEATRLQKTINAWWNQIEVFITTRVTNAKTEAAIIWSPFGGVVDGADGSWVLRWRHVLWSLSPTSLTEPRSGCRPWNDSKYCRVYDDVGIPL